jgi:hypothetical protein
MDKNIKKQIEDLEEKVVRQDNAIVSYREQLNKLSEYKSERDLYSELSAAFALASDPNDVFKKTLEALSSHLKARYYGVF